MTSHHAITDLKSGQIPSYPQLHIQPDTTDGANIEHVCCAGSSTCHLLSLPLLQQYEEMSSPLLHPTHLDLGPHYSWTTLLLTVTGKRSVSFLLKFSFKITSFRVRQKFKLTSSFPILSENHRLGQEATLLPF